MRHTAACVSGSIERRDDISARPTRATGWLYDQGILFAIVLIALLSALSGCGSGESDVGQTNGNSVTTVTGTVTNAGTGAPLADATVAATGFSTTTDSNGNFTLTGVPPGPQTLTVSRSGFISTTKTVTVVAGTSVSAGAIALTPLPAFGTVTGAVTIAGAGAPLSGATVAATGFSTTTDSNGNFTLTGVPPGPQTLTVSRSGFISTTKTVTVVAGKTVSTGTITLTPRTTFGTIIGTVTNAGTGAPLSGATVAVASIGVTATTDTNGNFTLAGVPPDSGELLVVKASGFSSASKVVTVVAGETVSAGTIALTPLPTASTSTGTVTITNAGTVAPLSGATVGGTGFSTTTDSNGNFTLTGLPPGPQTLTVSRSGFSPTTTDVTVEPGKTLSAGTIALTPLPTFGTITGTVTNARTGAPLSGATVGGTGFSTTTDSNGNFTLAGVPQGPEELLSVTASGFSPETKVVTVVGGEIVSADTIALLPVILIR